MTPLNIDLIHLFFQAAHMRRWNDHLRPVELTELDKQAHKAVIAWALAKFEESEKGAVIDWTRIIEGCMFEFMQRVILTDLKPPVFHRIKRQKGEELQEFVLDELYRIPGMDSGMMERFKSYFAEDGFSLERRVLNAAHYLATDWEFKIVYEANPRMYGIEETRREIGLQIEDHYDLIGVQRILLEKKSFGFVDFCGQLRFQNRWARSPRIPMTSVLGHSLMVALMSFLISHGSEDCPKRVYNNFYTALFHDLPEVLTKDIISPIKRNIGGLQEILDGYERELVEEKLLPLLPSRWHADLRYLLFDPGSNKVRIDGVETIFDGDIPAAMNNDHHRPRDGSVVKMCDLLSAYLEATVSIKHGVGSRTLREGSDELGERLRNSKVRGLDIPSLVEQVSRLDV